MSERLLYHLRVEISLTTAYDNVLQAHQTIINRCLSPNQTIRRVGFRLSLEPRLVKLVIATQLTSYIYPQNEAKINDDETNGLTGEGFVLVFVCLFESERV